MKNFIQPGKMISVIAAAAVTSGGGVKIGTLFGVAAGTAAIGEPVEIATEGVFTLNKTSAQAWAVGDAIYWNGTQATTASASGSLHIGVAVEVAANPSGEGIVRLNGAAPAAVVS